MCKISNISKSGYYKWLKNKDILDVKEILEITYIKEISSYLTFHQIIIINVAFSCMK